MAKIERFEDIEGWQDAVLRAWFLVLCSSFLKELTVGENRTV